MTEPTRSTGLETGRSPGRSDLQRGQVAQLIVVDIEDGSQRLVLETERLIESPNWTPDGEWLIVNGQGRLYQVRADGSSDLEQIPVGAVDGVNNDHVLSPDGTRIYFSAAGHLYRVPVQGGEASRISNMHPEEEHYSAEEAAERPGHAQLFRMTPDGERRERLTFDERVNWLPHLSPDGRWCAYISYDEGTITHPADLPVELRVIPADGGAPRTVARLFGGQGTLNTNGWAQDSRHFAFVAYPASA